MTHSVYLLLLPVICLNLVEAAEVPFRLDRTQLSTEIQATIVQDVQALRELVFDPGALDFNFKLYFGGTDVGLIEKYLAARVHFVGLDVDPDSRKTDPTVYAYNYGADFLSYYYHHDVLGERDAKAQSLPFESGRIKLTHPRVGFVGIGGAYLDPETSQLDRIDTWVHEARHSDCPRLPSANDAAAIDKEDYAHVSVGAISCANIHVPCPKGHALAGDLACDAQPWGAYSAGFIFSKNVFKACANCTEKQRQAALASATDDFSRLSPSVRSFVNQPNPPAPDLTSYDER